MKAKTTTAYSYARISTIGQSHFSIDSQFLRIRQFAESHGIEIIKEFQEEKSAKNFERGEWQRLEEEVKRKPANYIIVAKFDRFSRNATEALIWFKRFEKKLNVVVLSAAECYFINPQDPYFFKLRADALVNAQHEWEIIRSRTLEGQYYAALEGRHISTAPFGYINSRDAANKPILTVCPTKSLIVQTVFKMFLHGATLGECHKESKALGARLTGHSAIKRILENCIYVGNITVPSFKKEAKKEIKGLHIPLISESDFQKVQDILADKPRIRTIDNPDFPLRGFLMCICGNPVTGAPSRSKSGKLINYYHCLKCRANYNADRAHGWMEFILKDIEIPEILMAPIISVVEKEYAELLSLSTAKIINLEKDIKVLERDMDSLLKKNVRGIVSDEHYTRLMFSWERDIYAKKHELIATKGAIQYDMDFLKKNIGLLSKIGSLYEIASGEKKRMLLRVIFSGGLIIEKEGYRTPYINDIFMRKHLKINYLSIPMHKKKGSDLDPFAQVPPTGVQLNSLISLLLEMKL
jgi:site-specific DNA recombinase